MEHNKGIYGYFDKLKRTIVYIGKDSYIHKNIRKNHHTAPSQYSQQPFNRVLQNTPDRYEYFEIARNIFDDNELNFLEKMFIKLYSPKFNFTEGGEGVCGFKHTKKTRKRLSEINKGKKLPKETREKMSQNNARYWAHHKKSKEHIEKIANTKKGKKPSIETRKKMSENSARYWLGKTKPKEMRDKIAKSKSKYKLWDTSKTNYNKTIMFRNNDEGNRPIKCFFTRYEGHNVPIGCNYEFVTCEIISDLIKECD